MEALYDNKTMYMTSMCILAVYMDVMCMGVVYLEAMCINAMYLKAGIQNKRVHYNP